MSQPSGKFVLRLPPKLHQRLRDEAKTHSASLNSWIVQQLKITHASTPNSSKPNATIDVLVDVFGDLLEGVVLFGSTVRGEQREGSDIDLLVVLKANRDIDRSLYATWDSQILTRLGSDYSPQFSHLPTAEKFSSLWLEVAMEGDILFDPAGKLKTILRKIREDVAAGRYIRKISHGHPYWVHQENEHAK